MEILDQLKQTQSKTLEYFDLPESKLGLSYAKGKWDIKTLLHHLADAETVLYDRIRRAIAKPQQVVWSFDQNAWAKELNYATMPLALNQSVFNSVRNNIIYLAEQFYESHGANPYVHSDTGLRTLKEEFDKVAWHNQHHLNQIQVALSRTKS